jgi:hypothetical protein
MIPAQPDREPEQVVGVLVRQRVEPSLSLRISHDRISAPFIAPSNAFSRYRPCDPRIAAAALQPGRCRVEMVAEHGNRAHA